MCLIVLRFYDSYYKTANSRKNENTKQRNHKTPDRGDKKINNLFQNLDTDNFEMKNILQEK